MSRLIAAPPELTDAPPGGGPAPDRGKVGGIVFVGSLDAPIVCVVDAPSLEVFNKTRAMPPQATKLFHEIAQQHGFQSRDFAFITPCPPIPANVEGSAKREKLFMEEHTVAFWEVLNMFAGRKLVLAMGKTAAEAVMQRAVKITKVRGQVIPGTERTQCPVSFSLSATNVLRRPEVRPTYEADFAMLSRLQQSEWDLSTIVANAREEVQYEWIYDLKPLLGDNKPVAISLDTEGVGLKVHGSETPYRVLTVQIGVRSKHSYVLPVDVIHYNRWRSVGELLMPWLQETSETMEEVEGRALVVAPKKGARKPKAQKKAVAPVAVTDPGVTSGVTSGAGVVGAAPTGRTRTRVLGYVPVAPPPPVPAPAPIPVVEEDEDDERDPEEGPKFTGVMPVVDELLDTGKTPHEIWCALYPERRDWKDARRRFMAFMETTAEHPRLTDAWREEQVAHLKTLSEDGSVRKTGQNLKFDLHAMWSAFRIKVRGWLFDTQILMFNTDEEMLVKSLDEGVRRWVPGMAGYADRYNEQWDKERMDLIPLWETFEYGAGDTDATIRLATTLYKEVEKDSRQRIVMERVQMPALRTFVKVERRGIRANLEQLRELQIECAELESDLKLSLLSRVPTAVRRAHFNAGKELSFGRADFVIDTLFGRHGIGLRPRQWTKSTINLPAPDRIASVSVKTHLPLFLDRETYGDEVVSFLTDLIDYQKLRKLSSTYIGTGPGNGLWKYVQPDGRIHPSFFLHSTVTGRSSSRDPNAQNLPKRALTAMMKLLVTKFRKVLCASEGFLLAESDLSQAELRIAAEMADEQVMKAVYRRDGDIHATTAGAVMGITEAMFEALPEEVRKDKRSQAKGVNFGYIYGMGARKFKDFAKTDYGLDFTEEESYALRRAFFARYSRLEIWHKTMRELVRSNGYVRSLHGAIRHLPGIKSNMEGIQAECERQAINSPVQRFASDIGLIGMTRISRDLPESWGGVEAFIHDAVITEVREDKADEACAQIKYMMETPPLESWFGLRMSVPIKADVSIGPDLGSQKEVKGLVAVRPDWLRPEYD